MLSKKDSKRVHVTFGDSKRVISLPKGEIVKDLRYHFLRSFSDILSEHVAVANVKFQRFDDTFQDYIDLENDDKLENNGRVKAFIAAKYGEKVLKINPQVMKCGSKFENWQENLDTRPL